MKYNLDFSFPSQTDYFADDAGLDGEQSRMVEEVVENWRVKGRLSFPRFTKE